MKKCYFSILFATIAVLLVSGCIENVQPEQEQLLPGQYILSVNAVKDVSTKALAISGSNIAATWGEGETVSVYNLTKEKALGGTLAPSTTGSASTTLSGKVTGDIDQGDVLVLSFRSASYSSQDGTLAYIAANCDYAKDSVSVTAVDGSSNVSTEDAKFWNQQAIVKFTLMDDCANIVNATSLTITHGTKTLNLSSIPTSTYVTNGAGVVYVAIPGFASENISLTAVAGGKTYTFEKAGITFTNGSFYPVNVYLFNELTSPLTFEAIYNNTQISFSKLGNPDDCTIQYNLNHGGWTDYTSPFTINAGDKVQFQGLNNTYAKSDTDYHRYYVSDSCFVYGNLMSLVKGSACATVNTLEADYTFCNLFKYTLGYGNKIKSHEKKAIALPATTLTKGCYWGLFYQCRGMKIAPDLPAEQMKENCYREMFYDNRITALPDFNTTQLADGCFWGMFSNCEILASVPSTLLPAMTLAKSCYRNMFSNCKKIDSAPYLPAQTLKDNCYRAMFSNCNNLQNFPELTSTQLADSCYCYMFQYCEKLPIAPELPATTLAKACYKGMFEHCHFSAAPVLNAPILVEACYEGMFAYCDWLTSVTCMATDNSANNCTTNWLDHVFTQAGGNTRTVTTKAGTTWPSNSADGIPENWKHIEIGKPDFGEDCKWD